MAQKLYCQKCATPHQSDFPWLFWSGFRLDSSQCKDKLLSSNVDILKLEVSAKEETKRIAEKYRIELLTNPPKKKKYKKRKLKPEDLDKYVFWKPKPIKTTYLKGWKRKPKRPCPNCHEMLFRSINICPFCSKYTKPHLVNFSYPTKKRNEEIASLLNQGIYTLDQIGKKYGVSRERIRQIYKKMTGKPYDFRQEPVNITRLLDKWQKKQVKSAPRPNLGIYDAFFFRYKKLDQIALT